MGSAVNDCHHYPSPVIVGTQEAYKTTLLITL